MFSDAGDILIGDSHGNRFHVAVFGNDGTLLGEFECPTVKVRYAAVRKLFSGVADPDPHVFGPPEVEVIKLNSAKISRFFAAVESQSRVFC